jgi:hypothetical protein
MSKANGSDSADTIRRGLMWTALGLPMAAPGLVAARDVPTLQVSYSTDPYLTCDALQEEIARMGAIIAAKDASPALVKTARQREKRLQKILQEKRNCAPAPAKEYGPDMYDLPGTAAPANR